MGTIVLDGAYLRKDDSKFKTSYFSKEKKIFGWVIAANKPKMRDYLVYTNKEELRKEWMDAIEEVLKDREEGPLIKRDLILAGGMGAAKGPLPPPVEGEEEDLEEAYARFQSAHKHTAAGHMHLRFKESIKRSRIKSVSPEKQVEDEVSVVRILFY